MLLYFFCIIEINGFLPPLILHNEVKNLNLLNYLSNHQQNERINYFFLVYLFPHGICFNSLLSHFLNAVDFKVVLIPSPPCLYFFIIFFLRPGSICVNCLSLSVWQMKITQSKTDSVSTITGHLETLLSVSQSLSLLRPFSRCNVRKPTVGLHHKEIMSNCKCVCFFEGGVVHW